MQNLFLMYWKNYQLNNVTYMIIYFYILPNVRDRIQFLEPFCIILIKCNHFFGNFQSLFCFSIFEFFFTRLYVDLNFLILFFTSGPPNSSEFTASKIIDKQHHPCLCLCIIFVTVKTDIALKIYM